MEIVNTLLTALLSVAALFIIAKLMGHKQIAQLDFFDYICGITIGSIAAELATELEKPWKPLLALGIYGGVSVLLSWISMKRPRLRKYINGTPTILMKDGKLYRQNLKKAKLELSEFLLMCRQAGYFHLQDIQVAVFEYNGRISILPVSEHRPLEPADVGLAPSAAAMDTEVIMDGRILGENLHRMGLDEIWLGRRLKEQGYTGEKQVYLALCDNQNNITIYPAEG